MLLQMLPHPHFLHWLLCRYFECVIATHVRWNGFERHCEHLSAHRLALHRFAAEYRAHTLINLVIWHIDLRRDITSASCLTVGACSTRRRVSRFRCLLLCRGGAITGRNSSRWVVAHIPARVMYQIPAIPRESFQKRHSYVLSYSSIFTSIPVFTIASSDVRFKTRDRRSCETTVPRYISVLHSGPGFALSR